MRIATWNVNGLRARLDYVLLWLQDRRPDLVGLQELKMTDDKFPHREIEAAGYHAAVFGQKAWNGVAVLAREKLQVTQRGLPGQDERGARLITAKLGALSFTTVYVPNGKSVDHDDFPLKLAWLDALHEHMQQVVAPGRQVVICGDFNICPAPIDSWNETMLAGSIFHTDEERQRMRDLLGCGLHDIYREQYPETQAFSWWDYRGGSFHRKQGLRIDLLLATENVMARVRSVEIDRDYRKKRDGLTPSDHAPVIADLGE
jgi:exodeoxyribonuclease-3